MILKELRESKGYTQEEIAEKANMSIDTYRAYEQGKRDILSASVKNVLSISKILGCSINVLIDEDMSNEEKALLSVFGKYPENDEIKEPHIQALVLIGVLLRRLTIKEQKLKARGKMIGTFMEKQTKPVTARTLSRYLLDLVAELYKYGICRKTENSILLAIFELLNFTSNYEKFQKLRSDELGFYITTGIGLYESIYNEFDKR